MTMKLEEGKASEVVISLIRDGVPARVFVLPVITSPIRIQVPQGTRKDKIINVGEVLSWEHIKPYTISISSFFPQTNEDYVNRLSLERDGSLLKPTLWDARMKRLQGVPLWIIIASMGIAGRYLMTNYAPRQEGGVGAEIAYDVMFTQYVETGIRALGQNGLVEITTPKYSYNRSNVYVARKNDSLTKIALKTGTLAEDLIDINQITNIDNIEENRELLLKRELANRALDFYEPFVQRPVL